MSLHDILLSAGQVIIFGIITRGFYLLDRKLKIAHVDLTNDINDVKDIVNGRSERQDAQIQQLGKALIESKGKEGG